MCIMRSFATAFAALLTLPFLAQTASWSDRPTVAITDPGALFSTFDLAGDADAMNALKAAGLSSPDIGRVLAGCHESNWPIDINTLAGRGARRDQIMHYRVRRVCTWQDFSLLVVPTGENSHMPAGMTSGEDFFFIMGNKGLATDATGVARKPPHRGGGSDTAGGSRGGTATPTGSELDPSSLTAVKITEPDRLHSTYDLRGTEQAMAALEGLGLDRPAIDRIVDHADENSWPEDLGSIFFRALHPDQLVRIQGRLLAGWDDLVLVLVAASENTHLPTGMRPDRDIYMVYDRVAVEMK